MIDISRSFTMAEGNKMSEEPVKCPKCGSENPAASEDCDNCGISFDIYQMEKERAKGAKEKLIGAEASDRNGQQDNLTNCPSCGHPTDLSSDDCLKCGIVFLKYYDIQERALEGDTQKLDALLKQKAEHAKAVAERKEKAEAEKAERLRKQKEEREKAEALKKQKAHQAKTEENVLRQVETEKGNAIKQQQETFERELSAKQQAAEKEKAEAIEQLKKKQGKILVDADQKAEAARLEALKKQQEAFERQQDEMRLAAEKHRQEALDKQKAEFEKAFAAGKDQIRKELESALAGQKADMEQNRQSEKVQQLIESLPPQTSIGAVLKKYEGQTVGINHTDLGEQAAAVLAKVGDDLFSILLPESGRLCGYPFSAIASTMEAVNGLPAGKGDRAQTVYLEITLTRKIT